MQKGETRGVQGHALQGDGRARLPAPVRVVTDDRMAARGEMDADLMGAARLQPTLDEAERGESLSDTKACGRPPPLEGAR